MDVRRHPGSRRHPHVARAALDEWLTEVGVAYCWAEPLGGRRSVPAGSPDTALRNAAFRGYAAHMRSVEFAAALEAVLRDAAVTTTAVLCSESVWWRCHRRLIADAAVLLHDAAVVHVAHDGRLTPHQLTGGVRRSDDQLRYDGEHAPQLPLD